jgi:hypothetical protein
LQFSLQAASPETFGYTLVFDMFFNISDRTQNGFFFTDTHLSVRHQSWIYCNKSGMVYSSVEYTQFSETFFSIRHPATPLHGGTSQAPYPMSMRRHNPEEHDFNASFVTILIQTQIYVWQRLSAVQILR